MKNFVEKTKLELRHEIYGKDQSLSQAKLTKPVFLNEILTSNLNSKGLSNVFFCPKTPQDNPLSIFSPTAERKPSIQVAEKKSSRKKSTNSFQSNRNSMGTQERRLSIEPKPSKTMIRRKSCCCQWCGGISNFEIKHQDLVSDVQKHGRQSPQLYVSLKDSPLMGGRSLASSPMNLNSRASLERKGSVQRERRGKTMIETGQPKVRGIKVKSLTSAASSIRPSLVLDKDTKMTKDIILQKPYGGLGAVESSVSKKLSNALESSLAFDNEICEESVIEREADRQVERQNLLRRNSSAISQNDIKGSLNIAERNMSNNVTPLGYYEATKIVNPSIVSTNTTWSPQSKANTYNASIVRRILKNSANYLPISEEKSLKLGTPFSILTAKNRYTPQNLANESFSGDQGRDSKLSNVSNELSHVKKVELIALKKEHQLSLANRSVSVSKSQADLYSHMAKKVQIKQQRSKPGRDKLKSILGLANTKVLQVYANNLSNTSLRKNSTGNLKDPNSLNRTVFDSQSVSLINQNFDILKVNPRPVLKSRAESIIKLEPATPEGKKSTKRKKIRPGYEDLKSFKVVSGLSSLNRSQIISSGNLVDLSRARVNEQTVDEKGIFDLYLNNK